MKNLLKCEERIIIQQETHKIICTIRIYKYVDIDLSRQTNLSITQQSNFVRLGEDNDATMFFIAEKQQETILNFSLDSFRFIS